MNDSRIAAIPLAVRVYPQSSTSKESKARGRNWSRPHSMLIFDTETTVDSTQRLLFGSYHFIDQGVCREEGLFYADDLPKSDLAILERYAAKHQADNPETSELKLISRNEFLKKFFTVAYKLRALMVGFNLLERDGSVIATAGPVRSSDVRLRRAQALALENGAALRLSRELVDRKLAGQERVARHDLTNESVAHFIRQCRTDLAEAFSIDAARVIESQAAKAYWSAWRSLQILFPKRDLQRVPDHWRTFGSRISALTGSTRLATNPPNAMLNYLYALLEAETRLSAATLGLDPGIGIMHVDVPYRDSLALDLMEVVRPDVDAFVVDWIKRGTLPRNHFFEQRDGNCRLMADFASTLSQTSSKWAQLVAPVAEWFAREISAPKRERSYHVPARLTQRNKRVAKGSNPIPKPKPDVRPTRHCRNCGREINGDSIHCKSCSTEIMTEQRDAAGRIARTRALGPEAQQKRAATQQINALARHAWKLSDQPSWLTAEFYIERIQPALLSVRGSVIAKRLKVSYSYANDIRKGLVPHPRHWDALANLARRIPSKRQLREPELWEARLNSEV